MPAAKAIKSMIHALQASKAILEQENDGLRLAIQYKKKPSKQQQSLDLQQPEEYHSRAVFWSPRKIRDAQAWQEEKERKEEEEAIKKPR